MALSSVVGRLASLPAAPYLTRVLGPEAYGVAALIGTASSLGAVVALMGLDVSYARFAFEGSATEQAAVSRFCWRTVLSFAVLVGLAMGVVLFFGAFSTGPYPRSVGLASLAAAGTTLSALSTLAITRNKIAGRYQRLAIAMVAAGLMGVATNLLLARYWRRDAWVLLAGMLVGWLTGLAVNRLPLGDFFKASSLAWAKKREVLSLGIACTVTAPAYWVMTSADRWFLAAYRTEADVGIYNFACQFGLLAQFVPAAIQASWLPEVLRERARPGSDAAKPISQLWTAVALAYIATWASVSLLGGDFIRLLAAPTFYPGVPVVPAVAAGAILNGFAQVGMSAAIILKRLKRVVWIWILAAGCSVALNTMLIPRFGVLGAAWAQATSFAIPAIVLLWQARAVLPLAIPGWQMSALAAGAMAAVYLAAQPVHTSLIASVALKALGLAASAGLGTVAFHRKLGFAMPRISGLSFGPGKH